MTFEVTKTSSPSLPDTFNGEIYRAVGKYARSAVLYAFEQMGGPEGLAEWGKRNEDEFYTKLFPKIIARESEVHHSRGIDDLMDLLDGEYEVIDDGSAPVEEAVLVDVPAPVQIVDPAFDTFDIDDLVEFPDD